MNHIRLVSTNVYEANAGSSIWLAVAELLKQPRRGDVSIRFNGIKLCIYFNSCEEDIFEKYSLAAKLANRDQNYD